jgi:hypothetical protein
MKLACLAALLLVLPGAGQSAVPRNLPSRVLTPGFLNPEVTQANLSSTVCVSGYSATIRPPTSYTNFLKTEELRYRKMPGAVSDYQLDHFISLSLGGSPFDTRNLWMESEPEARVVDKLEAGWHRDLCAGRLTLKQAQTAERAYKRAHG